MASTAPTRLQQTVASLGSVSLKWLDPTDPLRKETVMVLQVSTGFTARMIEQALTAAFEELSVEKLLNFCAAETAITRQTVAPKRVLHILAGNVFTAWLPGAVITLLLGADCVLKPSSREPVFASLWKRSIQRVDTELGEKIHIVGWQEDLLSRHEAVVAYGSDETLELLRAKLKPHTRFAGYGHKFSVGVIWKDALTPEKLLETLAQAREAIEPFDLQGCLSPQIIYVEGNDPQVLEPLASQVRTMPQVKRFDSWEGLKQVLQSCRPKLSALGAAGSAARFAEIYADLESLGITRACSFSDMQKPPLSWRNGGISLVETLTSSAS